MRKNKKQLTDRLRALGLMALYLLVFLSHTFYLPQYVSSNAGGRDVIFKHKLENRLVNSITRAARAIHREAIKVPTGNPALSLPAFTFSERAAPGLQVKSFSLKTSSALSGRYAYLAFCVFRV